VDLHKRIFLDLRPILSTVFDLYFEGRSTNIAITSSRYISGSIPVLLRYVLGKIVLYLNNHDLSQYLSQIIVTWQACLRSSSGSFR
jgi:hypothetical protein